jgi:hypothetical protein
LYRCVDESIEVISVRVRWFIALGLLLVYPACGTKEAFKAPVPDAAPVQRAKDKSDPNEGFLPPPNTVDADKSSDPPENSVFCEPTFEEGSVSWVGANVGEVISSVEDIDGDSKAEIISYFKGPITGVIKIYKRAESGGFTQLASLTNFIDVQGNPGEFMGDDVIVFAGTYSRQSKDSGVKDLLVFIRNSSVFQVHVFRWNSLSNTYSNTAVTSVIQSSDTQLAINPELLPESIGKNIFKPVLSGNFLGGNYDGVMFHALNVVDMSCLAANDIDDCGDKASNLFLFQFTSTGVPELFAASIVNSENNKQPVPIADGGKRNYRLAAGHLYESDNPKGLDIIAQRRCRTDLNFDVDNVCDEPGLTALGGPGGLRAYFNLSSATQSAVDFLLYSAVDDYEAYNLSGGMYPTTYDKNDHTVQREYSLELGDADNDGVDDLYVIFHGDPKSQALDKPSLCIHFNEWDGFSATCDDMRKDGIPFQADYFVADIDGNGTDDLLVHAKEQVNQLTLIRLSCEDKPVSADTVDGLPDDNLRF